MIPMNIVVVPFRSQPGMANYNSLYEACNKELKILLNTSLSHANWSSSSLKPKEIQHAAIYAIAIDKLCRQYFDKNTREFNKIVTMQVSINGFTPFGVN